MRPALRVLVVLSLLAVVGQIRPAFAGGGEGPAADIDAAAAPPGPEPVLPLAEPTTAPFPWAAYGLDPVLGEGDDDGPAVEELRARVAFFLQDGTGYQSQAGPLGQRGSEEAWILEPMVAMRIRQNRDITHEVTIPVDVVSAASPDALDVVSSASRLNESVAVDVTTTYAPSQDYALAFRYGVHMEEPLRSLFAAPKLTLSFFDANTVLSGSVFLVADGFDPITPKGSDTSFVSRTTMTGNVSLTQVLSPTTIFDASLALTEQWGVLENTWNAVVAVKPDYPRPSLYRTAEVFPGSRNRNAVSARIAQHVPLTGTTVKLSYRFYWDENDVLAHTGELQLYQYLTPWLYVRGHYRLHQQSAIKFYKTYVVEPFGARSPRTSDSDLEALEAREGGIKLVLVRDRAPAAIRDSDSFDVGYLRYQRSNGLHVDYMSLGYARSF